MRRWEWAPFASGSLRSLPSWSGVIALSGVLIVGLVLSAAGGASPAAVDEGPLSRASGRQNAEPADSIVQRVSLAGERERGGVTSPAPAPLEVSPGTLHVSVVEGRRAAKTVTLRNTGSRLVSWTVSKDGSSRTLWRGGSSSAGGSDRRVSTDRQQLLRRVKEEGRLRVIVEVDVSYAPEKALSRSQIQAQRRRIETAQQRVVSAVRPHVSSVWRSKYVPSLVLTVNEEGLRRLFGHQDVIRVVEDTADPLSLDTSTELVGATDAWSLGYTGQGQTVVVLDAGIQSDHPFLDDSVVEEACFSTESSSRETQTLCPNGDEEEFGEGVACNPKRGNCDHGTHVAGIAVGHDQNRSGMAPGAQLVAIQVFSRFNDPEDCDGDAPCFLAFRSDQLQALEYAYDLRDEYNLAAVNMSLSGGRHGSYCNEDSRTAIIRQLRGSGVATVAAAGNDGNTAALGAPACIPTTLAVGSTQDGSEGGTVDAVSSFSNSAWMLDFWAPGEHIESSISGSEYFELSGTSMSTPHVAGAWALLKSRWPGGSVAEVHARLDDAGVPVTDSRNGITRPRLEVESALRRNERLVVGPTYGTVPPEQKRTLTVVIDAAELSPGTYQDGFTVVTSAQRDEEVSVSTTVVEASPARADVRPRLLQGATRTGTPLKLEQTITNAADSTGRYLRVRSNLPSFLTRERVIGERVAVSDSVIRIRPQATATLVYRFEETAERYTVYEDTIELRTNDPEAETIAVPTKIAVQVPRIAVDPPVLDFGVVPSGEPAVSSVELTNVGSASFEVEAALSSGSEHFTITGSGGPFRVPPGQKREVEVSSKADAPEIRKGVLKLTHDAVNLESPIEVDLRSAPGELILRPPYPNPLRTSATIEYSIPAQAEVRIEVYDLLGRRVAILKRKREEPGIHQVRWRGRSSNGRTLADGPYFVRVLAGEEARARKLTILR